MIHKDICPADILRSAQGDRPLLIDFDLATAFAEERPAFVDHLEIAGTLAYLAPEQTGRTGRPVDLPADQALLRTRQGDGASRVEISPPYPIDL